MLSFFRFLIRSCFYLLFFLVPIIFAGNTSELFEFNKMWLTFGLTLIIATSWLSIMLIEKKVLIRKTVLDIPILLFLLSQTIATIFSLDPHTSLWGYYSRFNGGLLSLLSYALLYFAFVSNIQRKEIMRFIYIGIASCVFVALWGLPSHFGYDPTCLLFRGTFDVSCWTAAFQPKVRIFSTLGQPDWLAAYLVYMLPLTTALGLIFWKLKNKFASIFFFICTILFYADLLYTKARSGMAGLGVALGVFFILYILFEWRSFAKHPLLKALKQHAFFLTTILLYLVMTFIIGTPFSQLDKFSLSGIETLLTQQKTVQKALQSKNPPPPPTTTAIPVEEFGGTDSGKIRLFVWQGAWEIFLHNPVFGTGVETFAYAYYQYRPAGHNLTSEWDYLYNKAHNEYLNYLATTGIVGFGTYMALLILSIWLMVQGIRKIDVSQEQKNLPAGRQGAPLLSSPYALRTLLLALLAAYMSILVTNFFGFSVVIMNIYLFLTPGVTLFLLDDISDEKTYFAATPTNNPQASEFAWVGIGVVWLISMYFFIVLVRFYLADISYAYGQNLDHANEYQAAYSYLHDAVATRPSEPVFQDEMSIDDAVLSTAFFQQKDSTNGGKLRDEAIAVSDSLITNHPNVITFWKSRVRIFYTLEQIDPKYLSSALTAIQKAAELAPTDAKVWYNLGLLYDQTGNVQQAISVMQQTTKLKADYRDAYYALAIFYRQAATDSNKKVINQDMEQKAVGEMHFILDNFGPNDDLKIKDTLSSWGEK